MQGGSTSNGDIILSGSSPKEDLISGFNTKGDLRHKWIYLEGISINMNSKDIFYNFFSRVSAQKIVIRTTSGCINL